MTKWVINDAVWAQACKARCYHCRRSGARCWARRAGVPDITETPCTGNQRAHGFRFSFSAIQKPVPSGMRLFRRDRGKSSPEFGGDVTADAPGLVQPEAGIPFDEDFRHLCRCVAVDPD